MCFGDILRGLIEERGLTQKALAAQLNIAPSTLSSYAQNVREPDFATLTALARFFGVTPDYLLDYPSGGGVTTRQEAELLRVFRSLTEEQRALYLEQGKVFIRMRQGGKERSS